MRRQFVRTVTEIFNHDDRVVLLLGDIGVFAFKELKEKYPNRVYNIGICEQSITSLASGLALQGLIPIVHTIAPFITERNYEQLKLNFGYQHLNGNFISVGNSYDYSALGCTHHCPADVNILKQIPNMQIICPGNAQEFDQLFKQTYDNDNPTYFRLSETSSGFNLCNDVEFNRANIIQSGNKAIVIVVGNLLDKVMEACSSYDVDILYYTTVNPFDYKLLNICLNYNSSRKILLCEPYYSGGLTHDIMSNVNVPVRIKNVGIPVKFLTNYGTKEEHDTDIGFTVENITSKLEELIDEKY
jgi:transketolase